MKKSYKYFVTIFQSVRCGNIYICLNMKQIGLSFQTAQIIFVSSYKFEAIIKHKQNMPYSNSLIKRSSNTINNNNGKRQSIKKSDLSSSQYQQSKLSRKKQTKSRSNNKTLNSKHGSVSKKSKQRHNHRHQTVSSTDPNNSSWLSFITNSHKDNLSSVIDRMTFLQLNIAHRLNEMKQQKIQALNRYNNELDLNMRLIQEKKLAKYNKSSNKEQTLNKQKQQLQRVNVEKKQKELSTLLTQLYQEEQTLNFKLSMLSISDRALYDKLNSDVQSFHLQNKNNSKFFTNEIDENANSIDSFHLIKQILTLETVIQSVLKEKQHELETSRNFLKISSHKSEKQTNYLQKKKMYLELEIAKMDQMLKEIRLNGNKQTVPQGQNLNNNTINQKFQNIQKYINLESQYNQKKLLNSFHQSQKNQNDRYSINERQDRNEPQIIQLEKTIQLYLNDIKGQAIEKQQLFKDLKEKKNKLRQINRQNLLMEHILRSYSLKN